MPKLYPKQVVEACMLSFEGNTDYYISNRLNISLASLSRWRTLPLWQTTEERLIDQFIDTHNINPIKKEAQNMYIKNIEEKTYGSIGSSINMNYALRILYKKTNQKETYDLSCILKMPGEKKRGAIIAVFETEEEAKKAFDSLHEAIDLNRSVWDVEKYKASLT